MKIVSHSLGNLPPIYIETDEKDWPEYRYEGGEWSQLMGMSWEAVEPPDELRHQFQQLIDLYYGEG